MASAAVVPLFALDVAAIVLLTGAWPAYVLAGFVLLVSALLAAVGVLVPRLWRFAVLSALMLAPRLRRRLPPHLRALR